MCGKSGFVLSSRPAGENHDVGSWYKGGIPQQSSTSFAGPEQDCTRNVARRGSQLSFVVDPLTYLPAMIVAGTAVGGAVLSAVRARWLDHTHADYLQKQLEQWRFTALGNRVDAGK